MRLQPPTVPIAMYREAYVELSGGRLVPARVDDASFTYLEDLTDDVVLRVTVDAEMVDGEPTCSRMLLEPGSQKLTKGVLSKLDPRWFATYALSVGGMVPLDEGSAGFTPDPTAVGEVLAGMPRRRSVDRSRLAEVAAAFRRGGVNAVVNDCHVSKSQAYRLIAEARKQGELPEVSS